MAIYKAPGVYVEEVPSGGAPIAGVGTSTAGFVGAVPDETVMPPGKTLAAVGAVKLVTNFTEFKEAFGDHATAPAQSYPGHSYLAHAVQGFFTNGGTRCFVTRVSVPAEVNLDLTTVNLQPALKLFEPIDEIAIVAAPGMTSVAQYTDIETHCESTLSRFAVLDGPRDVTDLNAELGPAPPGSKLPPSSSYAALYFPWIQVSDPLGAKPVPPSGHVAGIYARVDATRGVHKAPANEAVRGALDLKYAISKAQQEGLNLHGVNCLRQMNGNIRVWGARTVRNENSEFKYVSVRRLFVFLRESIDQSLGWAVFEPNNPDLWAKITRNLNAFLENVWRSGGLFGDTAEQAFFVKCDAETNPPAIRELGQVVTEIGVAITRPAEFVIFRLGQKAAS